MGSLFSRKKEPERPKITEQDKAVLDSIPGSTKLKNDQESLKSQVSPKGGKQNWPALKQQRDKLKQYQKKIQLNLEKERQLAKKLLQEGKKNKAKLLLKKKRYQEQTLERTDNQLENLEKMVQDVEFAQIQLKVADGLKQGNEALKKMHEIMSIEDVEKIMDETKEGIEYQREIDELLSGSLTQEDEDAVLEELEEMTKSIAEDDQEFPTELPEVPTNEPGEKRAPKAKETRREAEMVQA